MGLKVSKFDVSVLKGATIVDMKIDTLNESTITLEYKDGSYKRYRIPVSLVYMCEYYSNNLEYA